MKIRICSEMDIGKIVEIFLKSWRRTYREFLPKEYLAGLTNEKLHKKWSNYIKKENHGIFVALDEEENIIGFIAYAPFQEIENCLFLESLHVDLKYQGMGVGKNLIIKVAEFGLNNNYTSMMVDVIKGNKKAENVYKYLGAKFYKEFADDFDEDLVVNAVAYIWEDIGIIINK